MLIIPLPRRVFGVDCLTHWLVLDGSTIGGAVCVGCSSYLPDRVAPVEMADGGAVYTADALSPLCRSCSVSKAARIRAGWLTMTQEETVSLWLLVRRAQSGETAREAERERAVAVTLDELQKGAARALEQARTNQTVDDSRKVVSHAA